MAACDASYKFIFIDAGSPGADGDMNVFARTDFGACVLNNGNTLNLPNDATIRGVQTPFFFIGDDAFPLGRRMMKPFSTKRRAPLANEEKVFNYRLSRARRTIENAFGVLVMRWGCLRSEFTCLPEKVNVIVGACCALHNFLINRSQTYATPMHFDRYDEQGNLIEGEWRNHPNQLQPLVPFRGRPNSEGEQIRERLKQFFFHDFILPYQFTAAHCTNPNNGN